MLERVYIIKPQLRLHYIPIRIAKIKSSIHTNVIKNVKELQFLNIADLNVKWYKQENSFYTQ